MKTFYIVAVSGGVDSVVLLDKLATAKPKDVIYIVAHIDHGIRLDSVEDTKFVSSLAKKYGYAFEHTTLKLGRGASEETAREARYEFLFSLKAKYKAEGIITAHHQDDVLETMILNLLRGTGPRGLVGFSRSGVIRPFMDKTKQELVEYAKKHKLEWRDDSTNTDESYLRNYVRANFLPKLGEKRKTLLDIRQKLQETCLEMDSLTKKLLVSSMRKGELVRARFVILPLPAQHELLAMWLRINNISYDRKTIERLTVAVKTGQPGNLIDINSGKYLELKKETILLNI